jgi:hypothetical protein
LKGAEASRECVGVDELIDTKSAAKQVGRGGGLPGSIWPTEDHDARGSHANTQPRRGSAAREDA